MWNFIACRRGARVVRASIRTPVDDPKDVVDLLKELEKVAETFGQQVLFLSIAVDTDYEEIEKTVRRQGIIFPVLLNDETDRDYELRGVPAVFVIDGSGNIHFEHQGYRSDIENVLIVELDDLLLR